MSKKLKKFHSEIEKLEQKKNKLLTHTKNVDSHTPNIPKNINSDESDDTDDEEVKKFVKYFVLKLIKTKDFSQNRPSSLEMV